MQNRIKLFLLSLLTPLLCIGVSFGAGFSDSSYLLDKISYGSLNSNNANFKVYDLTVPFCVSFYNAVSPNNYDSSFQVRGCAIDQNYGFEQCGVPLNINIHFTVSTSSTIYCFDPTTWQSDMAGYTLSSVLFEGSFSNYSLQSVDYNIYSMGAYTPTNCSSIESQLGACRDDLSTMSGSYNTCIDTLNIRNGQIGTLSGQLASCNSDLASCTNGCDTLVSQCQENLSGCTSDLSSMTNYKDSLESQLQQCLAEIPEPCTGTGCDLVSTGINAVFSFFRERDDNMFSLPISNNIFLPRGITAYIDSGVVALAEEEKQKIKIDQGFEVLSGTYYHFFIGIVMLGIFCLFAYYVKKFISKSFIPKDK